MQTVKRTKAFLLLIFCFLILSNAGWAQASVGVKQVEQWGVGGDFPSFECCPQKPFRRCATSSAIHVEGEVDPGRGLLRWRRDLADSVHA